MPKPCYLPKNVPATHLYCGLLEDVAAEVAVNEGLVESEIEFGRDPKYILQPEGEGVYDPEFFDNMKDLLDSIRHYTGKMPGWKGDPNLIVVWP